MSTEGVSELTKDNIKINEYYKWKYGSKHTLIYRGKPDNWHQFSLAVDPHNVWCEVLDEDLRLLEEVGANEH